jgi:hypothetical protein
MTDMVDWVFHEKVAMKRWARIAMVIGSLTSIAFAVLTLIVGGLS